MRLYIIAARCPPPSAIRPAEQPRFSAQRDTTQPSLSGIVREADAAIFKEQREGRSPFENVIDRLGEVMPAGQPVQLRAHINLEILDQRTAQILANSQALGGAFPIDGSLDLKQSVDTAHDLDRDWRQRDFPLARRLAPRVLPDIGHGEERT